MSARDRLETKARRLIVTADDFGLTEGINRGVIGAHEHGIVTSASLMVRSAAAAHAAESARRHSALSVGLHFDAAEWRYRDGRWQAVYEVIDVKDPRQLRGELEKQLEAFERLVGRLPTHLDSHQHIHRLEPARSLIRETAAQLRIPLRDCDPLITYCGDSYGQTAEGESCPEGIALSTFERMIAALRTGWTEMGCHPGYAENLASVYASEREEELRVLQSAEARAALKKHRVDLASFHDYLQLSDEFAQVLSR